VITEADTVTPVFVKICGATRPDDARAIAATGADAIGLNFVPTSRRRIDLDTARSIMTVVPDGVMTVGVFRDQPLDEMLHVIASLGLTAAQLHGDEPPSIAAAVATCVTTLIKVVPPAGPWPYPIEEYGADIVMVDAPTPGGGEPFDWDTVGDLATRHRVLLAGGLRQGNVAEAIRHVRPWGLDVASGVESAPGVKDPDAVAAFVLAARSTVQR
jgi:phosphoribosylanthranilate isomerase